MNLCSVCKESFAWTAAKSDPSHQSSKSHHLTHRDWVHAIKQGCEICTLLRDALSQGVSAHLQKFDLGNIKNTGWRRTEARLPDCFLLWTQFAVSHQQPNLRIVLEANASMEGFKGPRPFTTSVTLVQADLCHSSIASSLSLREALGPSTDSDTAWDMMRHWISQCQQNHIDLGLRNDAALPWYPTRLLDLGDPKSPSTPRLIETATSLPSGRYLTLSHCWGNKKQVCATKENLQRLYNGVYNLPKTFQDAATATRNLGYRYLWIDSVCIVQDNQGDWAREAALMHKVYANAECNLAAAASRDSSGGLFFQLHGLHGQCVAKNVRGDTIDLFADNDLFLREVKCSPLQMIVDITTTRGSSDSTGPVAGGHMLIQGRMGRVEIIGHKTWPILCREDEVQENNNGPVHFEGFDISGLQFGQYYALLLGTCTDDPNKIDTSLPEEDHLLAIYLVLRPVDGQLGTYERCGFACEWYFKDDESRTLTGGGPQSRQDIPCEEYYEHDGTYIIRIIWNLKHDAVNTQSHGDNSAGRTI
ncbi:heterokaryon incompatibility protein [Fusarium mundagurra]|uniref:Heterokaryon incompatibility protein n=1 Tax=Fusarium mundagurra TaxID=1567541 RepID=A0A8H6DB57_9HYPO|nr:heterokaryon incompatibility protein [Fusarium mundagurra]